MGILTPWTGSMITFFALALQVKRSLACGGDGALRGYGELTPRLVETPIAQVRPHHQHNKGLQPQVVVTRRPTLMCPLWTTVQLLLHFSGWTVLNNNFISIKVWSENHIILFVFHVTISRVWICPGLQSAKIRKRAIHDSNVSLLYKDTSKIQFKNISQLHF